MNKQVKKAPISKTKKSVTKKLVEQENTTKEISKSKSSISKKISKIVMLGNTKYSYTSLNDRQKKICDDVLKQAETDGFITDDAFLKLLSQPESDLSFLDFLISKMQSKNLEIVASILKIVVPVKRPVPTKDLTFEQKIEMLKKIRSHSTNDPLRSYLNEIRRSHF